jgi:hypothetical protein
MHDRLTLSFSERNVEVEMASPTLSKRFDSVHMPFTHFTGVRDIERQPPRPRCDPPALRENMKVTQK